MNNEFEDYFKGKLSKEREEQIQQYICTHSDDAELEGAIRDVFDSCCEKRSPREFFGRTLPFAFAAAAIAALAFLLPFVYDKGRDAGSSIKWQEVSVPLGENRVLTLADGTVFHLNAGSRLTYPKEFSGRTRDVFMSGEAFLQVAKDPEHPFVVNSGDVKVTVKGTSFNFKDFADSRNVELLLMEGSVQVDVSTSRGVKELILSPGDKMRYNRVDGTVDLSAFSPDKYKTFYEDNSLHFFDIEMSDIAQELSRRFNKQIVVMDEELASRRYFAIFTNNESLEDVLNSMCTDGRMAYNESNGIIFLQPN